MTRIGFIGAGRLGAHLAESLLQGGHELTVHDSTPSAAKPLLELGAAWGANPREIGEQCEIAFTCLPSPVAVASVVSGENGLLEGLAPGSTWIDMSTNDRHELERLAGLAAAAGVDCLEAPVTGGVHKAAAGDITVLVGGDPEVFEAHRPLFELMGGEIFYIGPLGSASVIKVITNMLAFIHLVATGEALMLARMAGLDLAQSYRVIEASSGTSFVHETEGAADPERELRHRLHARPRLQGPRSRTRPGARASLTARACRPRRADLLARTRTLRRLRPVTHGGEAARGRPRRRPTGRRVSRAPRALSPL